MRRIVLVITLVGLGGAGGYLLGAQHQPPPPAPLTRVVAERSPIVVGDRGLSEADLRRAVKDELAAARPAAEDGRTPSPAARPPDDPAVLDAGLRRVSHAIAERRWTPADAAALGQTLAAASPEQRTEILHTLIPALNRGELKLTYRGELF